MSDTPGLLGKEKTMTLIEITQDVKLLTRLEKLQLIEEISKMLKEEEMLGNYFSPEEKYPAYTQH